MGVPPIIHFNGIFHVFDNLNLWIIIGLVIIYGIIHLRVGPLMVHFAGQRLSGGPPHNRHQPSWKLCGNFAVVCLRIS